MHEDEFGKEIPQRAVECLHCKHFLVDCHLDFAEVKNCVRFEEIKEDGR